MNDITKYEKIIKEVLKELRVRSHQKEDFSQECYVALVENLDKLDSIYPDEQIKLAATICRRCIMNKYRKEGKEVQTDSLSLPRVNNKASKISIPDFGITEDQLQDAVRLLPYDDYKIVHSLYVEGKTIAETAKDYEITIDAVRYRAKRGIMSLKKFFEV
jgi:RNA polymerase sigma factor (sigma-70 family)